MSESKTTRAAPDDEVAGSQSPTAVSRGAERILLVAICAIVGWFYLWTVRSTGEEWRWGAAQKDYYNLLIDGWLDGHLHMKVPVPEALLKLKDPYDPQTRPSGLALHDASLYRGHYYVYFGAAPVAVLMLPVRLLTGLGMPLSMAVLVFTYGGFLASVATWLAIRRRYFPTSGTFAMIACVLALGGAALGPVLLRRTHMWELPIAGGYCFAMLTLFSVFRSLHSPHRLTWLALAGFSLGLGIASRPTYLIASPFLAVPLLWWWWSDREGGDVGAGRGRRLFPWRELLSAAIPLAAIGALMALHNYLRFDDPLQFGQAYQLSLDYESKMAHFRPAYVRFNIWRYFFSAAQWTWHFPFIMPAALPPKPAGAGGHDDVFGLFTNLPLAWLAFAVPLAAWHRPSRERGPLLAWLGAAVMFFLGMAAVLCLFFGSLARYLLDFAPTLMLLACVGVLAVERWATISGRKYARIITRTIWGAAAIASVIFGVLYSLQLDALLLERNPGQYREAARRFNRLSYLLERAVGRGYGAVDITLRLHEQPAGTQETLLITGHVSAHDRIFLRHVAGGRVQLVYEGDSGAPSLSRPLAFDFSSLHRVRIALGALYPPETHPYFSGLSHAEIVEQMRRVRVELDGERVIDAFLPSSEATRGDVRIGRDASGEKNPFSGEILKIERAEAARAVPPQPRGDFARVWLEFPIMAAEGRDDLLVVKGAPSAPRAAIYVRYLGGNRAVVGAQATETPNVESEPFAYEPGRVSAIVIRLPPGPDANSRRVGVWIDRTLLWSKFIPWPPPTAGAVGAGEQAAGRVHALEHTKDGTDPLQEHLGPVRMRVTFPIGRSGTSEPLLLSGHGGHADVVAVEYLEGNRVRFQFDHWGAVLERSEPVAIDYTQPHEIQIDLGSGAEPPDPLDAIPLRLAHLMVKIDGRKIWEFQTLFYNAAREELVVGQNPIGASTCGTHFTGQLYQAQRVPRE